VAHRGNEEELGEQRMNVYRRCDETIDSECRRCKVTTVVLTSSHATYMARCPLDDWHFCKTGAQPAWRI